MLLSMLGPESIAYDVGAFVAGAFLLEYGADRFVDHTALVAERLGISQTLARCPPHRRRRMGGGERTSCV
jgi:hypothetical protein